jgi:hypothetical protein
VTQVGQRSVSMPSILSSVKRVIAELRARRSVL